MVLSTWHGYKIDGINLGHKSNTTNNNITRIISNITNK